MMGIWFLAISLGDLIAGRAAGFYASMSLPTLFGTVAAVGIGAAIVLALIALAGDEDDGWGELRAEPQD